MREIRKPYDLSVPVRVFFTEPSLTHQEFRDECDINGILARYQRTGLIDHAAKHQGQYGDFEILPDFQTALNSIILAQEMFESLPAKIRKNFNNDPAEFLSFVDDPNNADKLVDMGLATPPDAGRSAPQNAGEAPRREAAEPSKKASKPEKNSPPSGDE